MTLEELEKKASKHYYKSGTDCESPIPYMVDFAQEIIAAKDAEIVRLQEGINELRHCGDDIAKAVLNDNISRAKLHVRRWIPIWDKWRKALIKSPTDAEISGKEAGQ
jgi:hypothetical protein